jgi:hypothetical protein
MMLSGTELQAPPTADDLLVVVLSIVIPGSVVIVVVQTAIAIQSYIAAARVIRATVAGAATGIRKVAQLRPVQGSLTILTTSVVVVAQLLTLGLTYLGGNYTSILLSEQDRRWVAFLAVVDEGIFGVEDLSAVAGEALVADKVSLAVVALAASALLLCYRWAYQYRFDLLTRGAFMMAFPISVFFFLSVAVALVMCGLSLFYFIIGIFGLLAGASAAEFWGPFLDAWLPLLVGMLTCGIYFGACLASARGCGHIVNSWR